MDLHVTRRTIVVLRVLIMLWTRGFHRAHVMRNAVTSQAQLIYRAVLQQPRVRRTVRRVTGRAAFGLDRRVFERKRSLLVCVAPDACSICSCGQPGLPRLKSTVRVMTVAAAHRAFQNLVMEGRGELRLHLVVAAGAKLRIVCLQHAHC